MPTSKWLPYPTVAPLAPVYRRIRGAVVCFAPVLALCIPQAAQAQRCALTACNLTFTSGGLYLNLSNPKDIASLSQDQSVVVVQPNDPQPVVIDSDGQPVIVVQSNQPGGLDEKAKQ